MFCFDLFNSQNKEQKKEDDHYEPCGEWNNDFVVQNGGTANTADARTQASQVLDDVNRNVVMID